jgi:Spy/CpxP family protein refolding chaperone
MKKFLFAAVAGLLAVAPFTLQAEPPAPPPVQTQTGSTGTANAKGERGAKMKEKFEKLQTELGLTEEQSKKVQSILVEQRQATKGLKDDTTLTADQKKEKMKASRAEVDSKVSAILTPEQKAKWDQLKKDRPAKGGQ